MSFVELEWRTSSSGGMPTMTNVWQLLMSHGEIPFIPTHLLIVLKTA